MKLKGISLVYKVLFLFLIVVLPTIAIVGIGFHNNKQELEKLLYNELRFVAEEREAYTMLFLERIKSRVIDFSNDSYIVRTLQTYNGLNGAQKKTLLEKYMREYQISLLSNIDVLQVAAADFNMRASTDSNLRQSDISKQELFLKGLNGPDLSEIVVSGYPAIAVSVPIMSRQKKGKVLGVMIGIVRSSRFGELLTGEYIKRLGVLSTDGKWDRWNTLDIYLVNKEKLMFTPSRFTDPVREAKVDSPPVRKCLEDSREFTGRYDNYRGERVIGASMCFPQFGWVLLAEVDEKEVFSPVVKNQQYTVFTILLFTGLMGVFLYYFLRVIALQLRTLAIASKGITGGDYDTTVPVRSRDEIGLLSESFNEMTKRIKERTAELVDSRKVLVEAQKIARLGIWEWDIVKNKLKWSDELYAIYGIPQGTPMTFEKYLDKIHPDDRARVVSMIQHALQYEERYRVEYRTLASGGNVIMTRAEGDVIKDHDGKPLTMTGICQDITEIRKTQKSLHESEIKYGTLVENLQEGIWAINKEGATTYVNPKMAEMLGYTAGEMAGRHIFSFVHEKNIEKTKKKLERRKMGIREYHEFEFRKKNGDTLFAIVSAGPLMENDENVGALAAVLDLSERKAAEDALRESEERLRAILENMGNPVYMKDLEGKIIFVNRALLAVAGLKREDVVGKTVFENLPVEKAGQIRNSDMQAMESDTPIQVEMDFTLAGTQRTFLIMKFALNDIKGRKYAICGVGTEITSLKQSEDALRKSEKALREAQRIAHIGSWEWDIADNNLYLSDEVKRICGKESGPLEKFGQFLSTLNTQDANTAKQAAQDAVYGGEPFSLDVRIERPEGGKRVVHIEGEVIKDNSGKPLRMAGTAQDITELKQAEDEIRMLNRELEARVETRTNELKRVADDLAAANSEIETFTYSVAHDLRNPLRLIDGFSILLEKKNKNNLDAGGQENLSRIREAVKRMGLLIDDLLNLSFVMRAEIKREPVELCTLADSVAADLKKAEPERPVELRIAKGLKAMGDEKLLRMVLENLIGNAWKFTSKKTEQRIEFGYAGEKNGKGIFFVKDNGAGFDMKNASRLFEPFQRLHSSREYPGTGIGLATVKRIIQRHGGEIWAEGIPDSGAAFYFTLERG